MPWVIVCYPILESFFWMASIEVVHTQIEKQKNRCFQSRRLSTKNETTSTGSNILVYISPVRTKGERGLRSYPPKVSKAPHSCIFLVWYKWFDWFDSYLRSHPFFFVFFWTVTRSRCVPFLKKSRLESKDPWFLESPTAALWSAFRFLSMASEPTLDPAAESIPFVSFQNQRWGGASWAFPPGFRGFRSETNNLRFEIYYSCPMLTQQPFIADDLPAKKLLSLKKACMVFYDASFAWQDLEVFPILGPKDGGKRVVKLQRFKERLVIMFLFEMPLEFKSWRKTCFFQHKLFGDWFFFGGGVQDWEFMVCLCLFKFCWSDNSRISQDGLLFSMASGWDFGGEDSLHLKDFETWDSTKIAGSRGSLLLV